MRLKQRCSGSWIALAALAADQASKAAVRGGASWRVDGVFAIALTQNQGAAFSLLSGSGLFLPLLTAVLIFAVIAGLIAKPNALPKPARIGMWLIAGGGIGNLCDRIAFGAVTDFIELLFVRFAVFNLADIAVVGGAVLTAAAILYDERKKEIDHERVH